MKRLQQAYKFFTKEPDSNEKGVVEGGIYDPWGNASYYFSIASPPHEKEVKRGILKQMRSMPFFSREPRTTNGELPVAPTSSRPSATARHIRKNSKVTQILAIASEKGDELSASQVQGSRPAAQQLHRSGVSMPSVSVPAERRPTHAHTRHTNASQSANGSSPDTAAERAPRSQLRVDNAKADTLSARTRSHPTPSASTLGAQITSYSQPPSNPSSVVNTGQHGSTSIHARYPVDAFAPRVRGTTTDTTHKRSQHTYNPAPKQVLHLRKARSSVILSNAPPPLYAPKPLNHLERPCAETLEALAEPASRKPSYSNAQSAVATANALWPPSPVVPPLWNVMPPRAEQDPHRAAAIEADKAYRKIGSEGAYIRGDRDHKVRRTEQDSERQRPRHHRRAATENSRRHA